MLYQNKMRKTCMRLLILLRHKNDKYYYLIQNIYKSFLLYVREAIKAVPIKTNNLFFSLFLRFFRFNGHLSDFIF